MKKKPDPNWNSPANVKKAVSRWQVRAALRRTLRLCLRCGFPLEKRDDGHALCFECRRIMATKARETRATTM